MAACHHLRGGWLLTDARLAGHGLVAARRLPPGSTIVLRSDDLGPLTRRRLALRLKRIARARRLRLFLAGATAADARRLGADGIHLRSRCVRAARVARRAGLAVSAPVHDRAEARAVAKARIAYALISPLFATRSHARARTLPVRRFITLALETGAMAIALGGMTAARHRALRLRTGPVRPAWAAIDAWENPRKTPRQKRNCVPT